MTDRPPVTKRHRPRLLPELLGGVALLWVHTAVATAERPATETGAPRSESNTSQTVATEQAEAEAEDRADGTTGLSSYEQTTLAEVLSRRGWELESAPEGKLVERIETVTLDVFENRDPVPTWLNWFHTASRPDIIEQEVLNRPSQPFSWRLVRETSRNLRALRQLSLVLVVPIKSRFPNRVRLLVITKDVWSLRLNSQYRIKNGEVEYLVLQPSEENLGGYHLRIAGQYIYELTTHTFGGSVSTSRLGGSRLAVVASANGIVNRDTGRTEGSLGSFAFGQPLYSADSKWAFGTTMAWDTRVTRRLLPRPSGGYAMRTYDAPETPVDDRLPYRYHSREMSWQTYVTRSFGTRTKLDISTGIECLLRQYDPSSLLRDGYSPVAVRSFQTGALPRSDVRIGPFATVETHGSRFVSLYDVEILGLQEDFRLGHHAFVKGYVGNTEAQATRDVLGLSAGADYTISLGGSLGRLWTIHTAEFSRGRGGDDRLLQAGVRVITPPLGIGRLVYDGGTVLRYRNYHNYRYALGGDTRLRGYPSQQFLGTSLLTSNLEFRTRSVDVLSVLLGLVGFYDVGDAFDYGHTPRPKHSVGFGGRATIPQLQRVVGRLDVAFPLTPAAAAGPTRWPAVDILFSLNGQAFTMPASHPTTAATPLLANDPS